jgi:hypothetical protein
MPAHFNAISKYAKSPKGHGQAHNDHACETQDNQQKGKNIIAHYYPCEKYNLQCNFQSP